MELGANRIGELAELVAANVGVYEVSLPPEYFYKSLPLAIIDAVFSIGVTYTSTANTVRRFCENQTPPWAKHRNELGPEYTIGDFISLVGNRPVDELATHIYGNRQRTSAKNGILKAEVINKWAVVLLEHDINCFADVPKLMGNLLLDNKLRALRGQGSGLSLNYFKMLVGDDTGIKADRHILRFMEMIGIRDVAILRSIAAQMGVTPRLLDYAIWQKMSKRVA